MDIYVPPAYLTEMRRARRRHGIRVMTRVFALMAGLLVAIPLLLAGIGYAS